MVPTPLALAKGADWIHAGRAPRRPQARDRSRADQDRNHRRQGNRIEHVNAKQLISDDAAKRQRGDHTGGDAERGERQGAADDAA